MIPFRVLPVRGIASGRGRGIESVRVREGGRGIESGSESESESEGEGEGEGEGVRVREGEGGRDTPVSLFDARSRAASFLGSPRAGLSLSLPRSLLGEISPGGDQRRPPKCLFGEPCARFLVTARRAAKKN